MIQEIFPFESPSEPKAGTAMFLVYQFLKERSGSYFTSWEISKGIFAETNILMADESAARYARWLRKSNNAVSRKRLNENGKSYSEFTFHEIGR
jgi:hypothetical protein